MHPFFRSTAAALLGGPVLAALPVWADSVPRALPDAVQTAQATPPRYVPPPRGAPDARVSGGTRGPLSEALKLDVVAPEHVGLTLQAQPTLYWFNSRQITTPVEVTLVADETNKTVLKVSVPGPVPAGIHPLRLDGTSARLEPNVEYQWSVTAVVSTREPSRNIVASGMVKRIAPSDAKRAIPAASADTAAAAYAEAGIWYDAVDALSQAIQRAPEDRALRMRRGDLLEQVGLKDAAAFDRAAVAR